MKVKKLKKYLKNLPDDMKIVTRWYEDWYDMSSWASIMNVKENLKSSWWNWKYESENEEYWTYWPVITVLYI